MVGVIGYVIDFDLVIDYYVGLDVSMGGWVVFKIFGENVVEVLEVVWVV